MQRVYFILVGLLSIAGYRRNPVFQDTQFCRELQMPLKPKYKNVNKAKKAIIHATMAPTIAEYHERLFSCQFKSVKTGFVLNDPSPSFAKLRADLLKDQEEKSKSGARETRNNKGHIINLEACNGCMEYAENMKECPCYAVRYCSKECQIKHWPIHKKVCSEMAKRDEPNTSGASKNEACLEKCHSCSKLAQDMKQCPCRSVVYCSKECQIKHWPIHKKVCPTRKKQG